MTRFFVRFVSLSYEGTTRLMPLHEIPYVDNNIMSYLDPFVPGGLKVVNKFDRILLPHYLMLNNSP